jgi:hypothetical protein
MAIERHLYLVTDPGEDQHQAVRDNVACLFPLIEEVGYVASEPPLLEIVTEDTLREASSHEIADYRDDFLSVQLGRLARSTHKVAEDIYSRRHKSTKLGKWTIAQIEKTYPDLAVKANRSFRIV